MKELNKLRQELIDLKDLNLSIASEYGSELSAGDMFRQEEELEEQIKVLEEKDTTMYLVLDGHNSFKEANAIASYSSSVGDGIHFKKPEEWVGGEIISSDESRFWEILKDEATRLTNEINNLEYSLKTANRNKDLIEKAYGRKEK